MVVITTAYAQGTYPIYFTADELPNGVEWLPEPPDTTSSQFVYDITQYMWGKSLRDTPRGEEATAQSDVNASRLMAAGVFARLHTSEEFLSDMAAAREEYQRLSGGQAAIIELIPTPSTTAQTYNINGVPASETTNGIVIKNGQKVIQQ